MAINVKLDSKMCTLGRRGNAQTDAQSHTNTLVRRRTQTKRRQAQTCAQSHSPVQGARAGTHTNTHSMHVLERNVKRNNRFFEWSGVKSKISPYEMQLSRESHKILILKQSTDTLKSYGNELFVLRYCP